MPIMEIPDIHVRVLFDFEYLTKDGKEIKIHEGEKLYLIKKTNEDWWQVIRSSGRPFYVPASYVEEISRNASKQEKKFDFKEGLKPRDPEYRMRSCSVESQQTHENHKMKPVIPKRTIFDTRRIHSNRELVPEKPFENFQNDENDEDVDYVNICKQNSETNVDSEAVNKVNHTVDKTVSLSTVNNDKPSNFVTDDDPFTNGYSFVNVRTCSLSPVSNDLQMNLSNSLEELTQQIELKAKSINSGAKGEMKYPGLDNLVKSISKDMPVSAKNLNDAGSSGLKQVNNSETQKCKNDKLQYSGSFKTKHERDKWAKNYVLLSSMREEDSVSTTNEQIEEPKNVNDNNNNLNLNNGIAVEKPVKDNFNNNTSVKSDSSGVGKSDSDLDYVKSDKNCDNVKILTDKDYSCESNNERFIQLRNYFDSSTEDLDKNSINLLRLTPSDKGSTDSLLDVDNHYSIQEESICTTASDSLLHTSDTSEECLSSILREEPSPDDNLHKKKPALKRNSRVESCRLRFPVRGISPPIPEEQQQPTRELFNGWSEYTYTDGRTFFYNSKTGEKSWKPPRRRCNTDEKGSKHGGSITNIYSGSSSPLAEIDENGSEHMYDKDFNIAPKGWRLEVDQEKGCQCFVNIATGAKWFYSNDEEGRVYYFEENSSESSWTLPTAGTLPSNEKSEELLSLPGDHHVYSNLPVISRSSISPNENTVTMVDSRSRAVKSKSLILMEMKNDDPPMSFSSKNWPQLSDGHMVRRMKDKMNDQLTRPDNCVLKEGYLNRTKITENGKRLRKNWASSYVALTELFLLFFKDAKSFAAWKSSGVRPEMCVDLNGALIDRGDKVSSRKNVYMISTVLGMQVLIQNDCTQQAELWLNELQSTISKLPSGFDRCPRITRGPVIVDDVPESESKKFYKVTRSKSVKAKNKDGSMEDLTVSPAERQTKIKAKLKKFFHRRPTMESLVKKGIWKDEPAFGCYLDQAAGNEKPRVPLFVQRCISCIEKSEENMKTDGLYRASGNLSQVQKIRLQVDQNNLSVIEEEEDVHVLTGALKLFFRELKEPLIPYHLFQKAIKAGHNNNKNEKTSQFREIVKALPTVNYDTLKYLLQHLLRVTNYKEFNRMHIPNIAIVFGPTLMWPEQESNNMAFDLMQQNLVIECLLVEYDNIFR